MARPAKPKLKLFLLKPIAEAATKAGVSPWRPPYNVVFQQLVLAETEAQAREIAMQNGGDERTSSAPVKPWLDEKFSTCEEFDVKNFHEAGLVVRDFRVWSSFNLR